MNIRLAQYADKQEFYRLWKLCFSDSDSFCDWLFQNRFYPEYSFVLEENNIEKDLNKTKEIISTMQGVPYTVMIRDICVNGVMLCGVCTNPTHRKKGYMSQLFSHAMQHLREKNIAIAIHTPALLESYFPFQHMPVADALYIEEVSNYFTKIPTKNIVPTEYLTTNFLTSLHNLYQQEAVSKYSGCVNRTLSEFIRKVQDYQADGGMCCVIYENFSHEDVNLNEENIICGYAFFYLLEMELVCVEAIATSTQYPHLIQTILEIGYQKKCSIKLPPNIPLKNHTFTIQKKGVAGGIHMPHLLASLQLISTITIQISDTIIPENNGIFTLQGVRSTKPPALEISISLLLPILFGYDTFQNQKEHITIHSCDEFQQLNDLLPLYPCYVIDEY